jgi:hypothetical protein
LNGPADLYYAANRCADAGDIYLGNYEGWYDEREETFISEKDAELTDYKVRVTRRISLLTVTVTVTIVTVSIDAFMQCKFCIAASGDKSSMYTPIVPAYCQCWEVE